MDDADVWKICKQEHLWVFDKLILSRLLGYKCGPIGLDVPCPGEYVVRPCINMLGMGRGAEIIHIEKNTDHLPVGHFWCEVFKGKHISVDYHNGCPILAVEGSRESNSPLWKFSKWTRIDESAFAVPHNLVHLFDDFPYMNIEYIDGKIIEVHLRENPDFVFGNSVAIPVWNGDEIIVPEGMEFIVFPDYHRKGFYVDSCK